MQSVGRMYARSCWVKTNLGSHVLGTGGKCPCTSTYIPESFNGRTSVCLTDYQGSNPCSGAFFHIAR